MLTLNLEPLITSEVKKALNNLGLENKINELLEEATQKASKIISIKLGDNTPTKMGVQHKQFATIVKLIAMGENLMVKGEMGNGKSHILAECARALSLPFHSLSVSNQTTKTDLVGFVDANGIYRYNGFITAFKNGGIFNMDEIDAGNANVLVVLNSALSNGFIEAPNGELLTKHKDFRFVSTANTTGRGATQKYVGRNKLDSATLDRFAVIEFELDEEIELSLCGGDTTFHNAIKTMRKECGDNYDFQISQRSSTRLYKLLLNGFEVDEALEIAVFKGCDEDIKIALTKSFKSKMGAYKVTQVVEEVVEEEETEEEVVVEEVEVEETEETEDYQW